MTAQSLLLLTRHNKLLCRVKATPFAKPFVIESEVETIFLSFIYNTYYMRIFNNTDEGNYKVYNDFFIF